MSKPLPQEKQLGLSLWSMKHILEQPTSTPAPDMSVAQIASEMDVVADNTQTVVP
eukprot:CAMPEP_0168537538 /NCGR_PEP_ID=MMETSP0405-20121227/20426_1 /TAXON_ID=498012 /ORGANISM="Trichosphaerium sp, Strain Am-I-7 wt" /LENGTH=54 /DNA_ID=CAMNT_0008566197 /DNA_START=18 /DNA_END=179 /DNA_ORIENTATION=-